jgi:Zn-dependent protease with chaperone function
MIFRSRRIWLSFLCAAVALAAAPKLKTLKPGLNLFSKEQDVQLGKESAAEVEKQMQVITDPRISSFIEGIGKKLLLAPEAEAQTYAYSFKVVNEKSINAFALPGGPTFTHTGLISAADNEAQIAGVLAHEISHVVLRHGTSNVSKANLLQIPAMLGGAVAGGGMLGQLAQLGVGLGANSLMLRFSRGAESDADLMGTRIMHSVGYNPIEMARFFEKLEAESGKQGKLSQFFSDHPNPGNRVKAVSAEIQLLPQRSGYDADSGKIAQVKQLIGGLPAPPPPKPQASAGAVQGTGDANNPAAARPNGQFQEFKTQSVQFQYPANWKSSQDQQSGEVTLISPAGAVGGNIGYGAIVNFQQMQARPDLNQATQQLVQQLQQRDPNVKVVGESQQINAGGGRALATKLQGPSAFTNNTEEITLVTVDQPRGLFYMLLIAPSSERQAAQQSFNQMVNTLRFAN